MIWRTDNRTEMEYYNNILCVTCEELTSGDNPVMKYITLYQNVRRGNIESINRGGGEGNVALYSYSSLPEKYKKRWVERHGEPEKQMREEMIRNIVKKDEKAENFSRITVTTRTVRWSLFPRM